jgi:hypothetical protein
MVNLKEKIAAVLLVALTTKRKVVRRVVALIKSRKRVVQVQRRRKIVVMKSTLRLVRELLVKRLMKIFLINLYLILNLRIKR